MTSATFWQSNHCQIMVNPRDPTAQAEADMLASWVKNVPALSGHVLFATSGSSAGSKWVALSRNALLASARMVNQHLSATSADRWLLALPEFHVGGMGILARCYDAGSEVIRMEGKWNPQTYHDLACSENVTLSSLVPTQLVDLSEAGLPVPAGLRSVLIGGGRLDDAAYQKAQELGWPVMETYGMTEASSQVATATVGSRDLTILPDWQTKRSDQGCLMIKGDPLMTAYVCCQENHCSMVDPKVDDWLVTEDIVELHGDTVVVKGRADRCVKVLGELVNLVDVEKNLAVQFPEAHQWVVTAIADARMGSRLILCSEAEIDARTIITRHNEVCKPVERIDAFCCMEKIPRSSLGKVRYGKLGVEVAKKMSP